MMYETYGEGMRKEHEAGPASTPQQPTETGMPAGLSLATVPSDVVEHVLSHLRPEEVAMALPASRRIASIGSDVLSRRQRRVQATLCPPEGDTRCRGSLLCAIAADDADAVRDILFARAAGQSSGGRAAPPITSLCVIDEPSGWFKVVGDSPCRVFVSLSDPGEAAPALFTCRTASPANVAVTLGAPRTLAAFLPRVARRRDWQSVLDALLAESIDSVGKCVWVGHRSTEVPSSPHGRIAAIARGSPYAEALGIDTAEARRAASAISWDGEASRAPNIAAGYLEANPGLADAIRRGTVMWDVIVYDAVAVAGALLSALSHAAQQEMGRPPPVQVYHPLHRLNKRVLGFIGRISHWVQRSYGQRERHRESARRPGAADTSWPDWFESLPKGYRSLLDVMEPFFVLPSPADELEYEAFLDVLKGLQEDLHTSVAGLTGWARLTESLLDAGFDPEERISHGGTTTTVWDDLENDLDAVLSSYVPRPSFEDVVSMRDPLQRPFGVWVGGPVAASTLDQIGRLYEQDLSDGDQT